MASPLGLLLVLVASWLHMGTAQIRVLGPDYLAKSFGAQNGRIQGSTATFGAPFYGDRVLGRLLWAEPKAHHHCDADDYEVSPPAMFRKPGSKAQDEVRIINIIMVRRGECSFVTKVKVASAKGAHAVIIVDREDSKLTSHSLQNIIVADDGYGKSISIPSVLISNYEGEQLIAAAKHEEVVVELAWDVPTDKVVAIDLWMNSAAGDSQKFLKSFTEPRKLLNEVVKFTPHYHIFSADPTISGYSGLCSDPSARYCAEDPDGAGPVSGKDVIEEDVRQLCIHEITRVPRSRKLASEAPVVFYAEKWWNYVEKLPERCPIDSQKKELRFGKDCSERLMKEVGIDVDRVQQCVATTSNAKLESELVNKAWSPRALRVNGWRFNGILEPDLVTRAVCAGFVEKPPECESLLKPRDPSDKLRGAPHDSGISMGVLVASGLAFSTLFFCISLLFRRSLVKLRSQVREEVLLEVSDKMLDYNRMEVDDAIGDEI